MAKQEVNGKALKIVEAINRDAPGELNAQRFRRLCGMFGRERAEEVLKWYDKLTIVKEALKQTGSRSASLGR